MNKPEAVSELFDAAYLAAYRAAPKMKETNAKKLSMDVTLKHASGKHYRVKIDVHEVSSPQEQ